MKQAAVRGGKSRDFGAKSLDVRIKGQDIEESCGGVIKDKDHLLPMFAVTASLCPPLRNGSQDVAKACCNAFRHLLTELIARDDQ